MTDSVGAGAFIMTLAMNILGHPSFQEHMYPLLPKAMRNPEACKRLIEDPEVISNWENLTLLAATAHHSGTLSFTLSKHALFECAAII